MKKLLLCLPAIAVVGWAMFLASTGTKAACLAWNPSCSEDVTVSVEIQAGDVCIGTTGAFDFGT